MNIVKLMKPLNETDLNILTHKKVDATPYLNKELADVRTPSYVDLKMGTDCVKMDPSEDHY